MTTSYVTYTYYTNTFLGTAIASASFAQLALRASAVIDSITFNRAGSETDADTVDAIRMATCAVAEKLQLLGSDEGNGGIKSESIGSNSVTYQDGSWSTWSYAKKLANAASLYLAATGLMFKGFNTDEEGGVPSDED